MSEIQELEGSGKTDRENARIRYGKEMARLVNVRT